VRINQVRLVYVNSGYFILVQGGELWSGFLRLRQVSSGYVRLRQVNSVFVIF